MGHYVVPDARDRSQPARGRRVELLIDLGWRDTLPGFQAEGLAYRADGVVVKGVQPLTNWVPIEGPTVDVYLEAAANPQLFGSDIPRFAPTPLGDVRTAGDAPLYRLAAAAVVVRDDRVVGLLADLETMAGLIAEQSLDPTLRAAATNAVDRALDVLDSSGLDVDAIRDPLTRVLDAPATVECSSGLRGRARAHRLRLAVADARDPPQGAPGRWRTCCS